MDRLKLCDHTGSSLSPNEIPATFENKINVSFELCVTLVWDIRRIKCRIWMEHGGLYFGIIEEDVERIAQMFTELFDIFETWLVWRYVISVLDSRLDIFHL